MVRRRPPARRWRRDPANELFDRACDLLLAGRELREAAEHTGHSAAVAASLNCVEATLGELADTCRALGRGSDERLSSAEEVLGAPLSLSREEFSERFDETAARLDEAREACERARATVGPTLAGLTAI